MKVVLLEDQLIWYHRLIIQNTIVAYEINYVQFVWALVRNSFGEFFSAKVEFTVYFAPSKPVYFSFIKKHMQIKLKFLEYDLSNDIYSISPVQIFIY